MFLQRKQKFLDEKQSMALSMFEPQTCFGSNFELKKFSKVENSVSFSHTRVSKKEYHL